VSSRIPFDEIVVGEELGPVETHISEKAVRNYCEDWNDPHPWYLEESPFGGPVAPPAFMAGLTCFQLLSTKFDARATIGAKTAYECLAPVPVGRIMTTTGRIADKYVKRGLEYVVIESTSYEEGGRPFRRGTDHILLSLERVDEDANE